MERLPGLESYWPWRRRHTVVMRPIAALGAGLAVAMTAACGSTVSSGFVAGAGSNLGSPDGLGLGVTGESQDAAGIPSTSSAPSAPAPGAGSSVSPSALPTSDGTPGPAAGPTSAQGSGPVSGFGFTATTANLGIAYLSGGDGIAAAAGYSSLSTGDGKAYSNALIKLLNNEGGVLGRKIVPIFHETKAADSSSNPEAAKQATCDALTQDNKVFAAVNGSSCFVQRHVPYTVTGSMVASDQQEFTRQAPYFYDPNIMNADDEITLAISRATARGFLTPKNTIGIWYLDDPVNRRIAAKWNAALKAKGLTVAVTFGTDGQSAVTGAGVLPMRAAGVDRVVSWVGGIALYMVYAQQQGYQPKYLLSTYNNLASVLTNIAPKQQLVDSSGIGWQPRNDMSPGRQVKLPGTAICAKAAADSGQAGAGSTASFILYSYCDGIRLFVLAARASGSLTPEGIRAGITKLGAGFPSGLNFRSAWGLGRYDGALGARDLNYDIDCDCFRYVNATLYTP